jgi:putative flippase GtrA
MEKKEGVLPCFRSLLDHQFVRFCTVGASCTLLDLFTVYVLVELVGLPRHLSSPDLARGLATAAGFACAVANGYYWNSRWTFGKLRGRRSPGRAAKYLTTYSVSLVFDIALVVGVARLVPSQVSAFLTAWFPEEPETFAAKIIATVVMALWNFTVSRRWVFNH